MDLEDEQDRIWQSLYESVVATLAPFGADDALGGGDYLIVDDNYGWKQIKIEVQRLHIFRPLVIEALRSLVLPYQGWEIVMAVDVPGTESKWPFMGVTIRPHEIIDGLRREFLPPEFQSFHYSGSRPGTGYE